MSRKNANRNFDSPANRQRILFRIQIDVVENLPQLTGGSLRPGYLDHDGRVFLFVPQVLSHLETSSCGITSSRSSSSIARRSSRICLASSSRYASMASEAMKDFDRFAAFALFSNFFLVSALSLTERTSLIPQSIQVTTTQAKPTQESDPKDTGHPNSDPPSAPPTPSTHASKSNQSSVHPSSP